MRTVLAVLVFASAVLAVDDFVLLSNKVGAVTSISFINATHGFVGDELKIMRTTDGGYTWTESLIEGTQAARYLDVVASGKVVVATGVGDSSAIPGTSYSLNAGIFFNKTDETHLRQQWYSVEPIKGADGSFVKTGQWSDLVGGDGNGVATSSNGGKSWTDHNWGIDTPARFASFVSTAKGWVAGGELPDISDNSTRAVIASTTDGGWTWKQLTDTTQYYNNGIAFASETVGWVICVTSDGSIIKKTTDAGNTWITQVTTDQVILKKLWMLSATEGWAVGGYQDGIIYHGQILHTTDGGVSWPSYAIRGVIFNDIAGSDSTHVWACGVSESSDGGVVYQWVKS
ncbi:hypothetical protein Pelo_1702 [Pelomyxa schiedti]|nr:hypothetical protein Pelo_1702 [Pelomyxa schiedti]